MSDADRSKEPRPSQPASFPHAPDEAELDQALAAAADLAAGLVKEVRESDPPAPRTPARDERLALDKELAELERLAHKTAEHLGADPSLAPAPPPKKKRKRAPSAVPDFMSEFTGPTPQASPPNQPVLRQNQDGTSQDSPDAADTVMGEALPDFAAERAEEKGPGLNPGALTSLQRSTSEPTQESAAGRGAGETRASAPPAPPAEVSPFAADLRAIPAPAAPPTGVVGNMEKPRTQKAKTSRAEPKTEASEEPPQTSAFDRILYPAAERIVGVLETIDKPFAWLGEPAKQMIGWLAIATLLVSAVVLAVAVLT